MLTVGEALGIGVMQRARVIAGTGGLDRIIRSITIMDTPDIKNWLRGGELLLSNIFVIRDSPEQQIRLVQDLAESGAAGLGIKLKRYVESVPGRMVELADALNLPLIEMPVDCAWVDVMVPLYTEIINRQAARLARAQEIRFTNAFLWDLLNGYVTSLEVLESRARYVGMPLASAYAVMVLDIDGFERFYLQVLQRDESRAQELRERFVRIVRSASGHHLPRSLAMDLSDSVTVLAPVPSHTDPADLLRVAGLIKNEVVKASPGITVSVGISRLCQHPLHIPRAYREARQAVALGRELRGAGHTTGYHELGSYRVLLSQGDRSEVEAFCREITGPLEEYEKKHPGLVETLATFLRCNCDPGRCARQLFVHPNTVRYRLRKVEALCGVSLDNQEHRFNLQLALKLRRLVHPENHPPKEE